MALSFLGELSFRHVCQKGGSGWFNCSYQLCFRIGANAHLFYLECAESDLFTPLVPSRQMWPHLPIIGLILGNLKDAVREFSLLDQYYWRTTSDIVDFDFWRSGESTRLPPMWPGFDSQTRRLMWVEFVGSHRTLQREVFLRVLRFSPLHKNQYLI